MKKTKVNPRVYAALYLGKLNASEKIALGNRLFTSLTGDLDFPDLANPSLAEVQAATTALGIALAAAQEGGTAEKEELEEAENAFDNIITRLKEQCESIANTTPAHAAVALTGGGFQLSKTPEKSPVPMAVTAPKAIFTGVEGTIQVQWNVAAYAKAYQVFMTLTPNAPDSWKSIEVTTKRKLLVENLQNNSRYYFRIVTIGVAGNSIPSIPVNQITTMTA